LSVAQCPCPVNRLLATFSRRKNEDPHGRGREGSLQCHAQGWSLWRCRGYSGWCARSVRCWSAIPGIQEPNVAISCVPVISTGTFASIVSADNYSRSFEKSRTGSTQYKDEAQAVQDELNARKSSKERTMDWLQDNRYSIVFGSWVASMAAALGIVGRSPYLTGQQKLVQARVYAQGFTIAAVIISLAFEGNDRMAKSGRWETVKILDPNDPEHKHMIEKRIHHERYAGEDQWMDMVEAEERRIKEREAAVKQRTEAEHKNGKSTKNGKKHDDLHGKPTETKDEKLNAP